MATSYTVRTSIFSWETLYNADIPYNSDITYTGVVYGTQYTARTVPTTSYTTRIIP